MSHQDHKKCVEACLKCAALCNAESQWMSLGSSKSIEFCRLCCEICEACADECAKQNDAESLECAEACRNCAEVCRHIGKMAA